VLPYGQSWLMETNYKYTCPTCSQECSVEVALTGQNVVCPHCSQEFFATPPDSSTEIVVPDKLPFFKSGRRRILEGRLKELIADGEFSDQDERTLQKTAELLGLKESDLDELRQQEFFKEFGVVQRRVEQAWQLTDEDLEEIEGLKRKYGVKLALQGNADLFRKSFLLETKGQLPDPIYSDLMLGPAEAAYYCCASVWHETRVVRRGYAGASFSVPTGIKGFRFRFGRYNPIRSEELTALARGTLWVTSKRLIFQGDLRNTEIEHKKIMDTEVYSDSLKVEKSRGKPGYFAMNAPEARYITALIGVFRA